MTRPASCTAVFPFPPSVNGLFSGKARRFKSPAYKAWLHEAEFAWIQQSPDVRRACFSAPVAMTISLGRPDNRTRDPSNYVKAVEDFLVRVGLLVDDSLVHDVRAHWDAEVVGCRVTVEPLAQVRAA